MKIKSPLEELSSAFSPTLLLPKAHSGPENHEYWKNRIIDDYENEILYIVPAGFSHASSTGLSRLVYYQSIWEKAVSIDKEKNLYPLGRNTHTIKLKPEPENRHDKYALKVEITFHDSIKIPQEFKINIPQDIGYIPKRISEVLTRNKQRLNRGKLINVYGDDKDGMYFGRIAFPYGKISPKTITSVKPNMQRFISIMES